MVTPTTCAHCGHAIVPQSQYKAARAAGRDVRAHEGRGLCTPCYTHARVRGRRTDVPQVRSGELALRSYSHSERPEVAPPSPQEHAAALTCAERVPVAELRHVLEVLGLLNIRAVAERNTA